MIRTTPFLFFDGNCLDAMIFYQQCFGGEISHTKVSDMPMKELFPIEKQIGLSMPN